MKIIIVQRERDNRKRGQCIKSVGVQIKMNPWTKNEQKKIKL